MKRLDSLDGLRGVLALYVLLGHMAPYADLPAWLQSVVSHGGAAVDMFFMLSGLVITQSLLHAGGHAKPFLIARIARIFPVFLVVFAASVALQPLSCGFDAMPWIGPGAVARSICATGWPASWPIDLAAHLTMTHGLFPNAALPHIWVSFLGAAWSLSTEWQFYLLALLVAGHANRLTNILLALAIAGAAWRIAGPLPWHFSRAFLPNEAAFFALGVASVPVVRADPGARRRYGMALLACLAICATQRPLGKLLPPLAWTWCLAAEMAPERAGCRLGGVFLRSRPARALGAISYCVYLVNEPVQKLAGRIIAPLAHGDTTLFTLLWLPAAIGAPLLVSALMHRWVEAPAQRLGRDIARRVTVPSVQVSASPL